MPVPKLIIVRQLGWLIVIWGFGVTVLGVVAYVIRLAVTG